ncbi:MAG TPA: hypothetical protein VFS92_08590 [Planctomycetota bacterium]|nr:hypothetical protein [Planctomycetota bacterium]
MNGRLADALTGAAIPGARLTLHYELQDGTASGGIAIPIGPDGAWRIDPRERMRSVADMFVVREGAPPERHRTFSTVEEAIAGLDYSLRASANGYEPGEIGDPGAESALGLRPEHRESLPGTIRVESRWPDGVRYGGRLLVEYWSEERPRSSQWVLPDADGDHLVAGVPPGRWRVRAAGREDNGTEIRVPEAGEVRVVLRVPRKGVQEPEGAPSGPPREVEVATGAHPVAVGAFVRAESRAGAFFRSEVEGASASFAALPAGDWTFVLQVPGQTEVRFDAEVPAAPDRLRLEFPASPK